jgi:cytochrome c2
MNSDWGSQITNNVFWVLGMLVIAAIAPGCGTAKSAAERGREVYDARCYVCHEDTSNIEKVGPGLKGIYQMPPHEHSDGKVYSHTEAEIREMVVEGTKNMPPMREFLTPQEIEDVLAYLRTL